MAAAAALSPLPVLHRAELLLLALLRATVAGRTSVPPARLVARWPAGRDVAPRSGIWGFFGVVLGLDATTSPVVTGSLAV